MMDLKFWKDKAPTEPEDDDGEEGGSPTDPYDDETFVGMQD